MVEILIAPHAGFCFGVKRAIQMAEKASQLAKEGKRVFTMGPLIHNPQEVERLRKEGV
ncbi:MAG: 4-hydroxy-3-methylbut-2-enyl diphosphate reductase, partial [Hydrogenobacter sp.]